MTTLQNFRTKLRTIRKDKDLTLANIACDMDLSTEAYRKIENGTTTLNADHLDKLAKAYNMDLIEMLTYGEEKYNITKPKNNVSVVNNGTIEAPNTDKEQTATQQAQTQNEQLLKKVEMLLAHNQQLIEENARLRGAGNL
jgi:transcriptional regulator with XRE-family HTH domain